MSEPLRVLIISSEATPVAQTGGLGDVVAALAGALRGRGVDARIVLPRYGWIDTAGARRHPAPLTVPAGGKDRRCALFEAELDGVPLYLVEHDMLFGREHVYGPPGAGYGDNARRFAVLSRAALVACAQVGFWPQVFHAHDWPTALVPVYLNTVTQGSPLAGTASLLTIHNLAHQGWFDRLHAGQLGLDSGLVDHLGLQAFDAINLLRGGILHATMITTVSPTYAQEIQHPAFGEGLDGTLRTRRADLFGVLNGIDDRRWDPGLDPALPRNYTPEDLGGKAYCKAILQQRMGLAPRPAVPLVGMVGRLTEQKGVDLVLGAAERLLPLDLQLAVLGEGEPWAEARLAQLAEQHRGQLAVRIGFDDPLARLIEAGSDLFLMPSRWEPCGLNQMYSQRYGTLPIVRATGGLNDTVDNCDEAAGTGTGFKFYDATPDAVVGVTAWAVRVYRENNALFRAMMRRAMSLPRGWDRAAAAYEYLYRLAIVRRRGR